MGIRDLLKKKDRPNDDDSAAGTVSAADSESFTNTSRSGVDTPISPLSASDFTFIRSDTHGHEVVYPPDHPPAYAEQLQQEQQQPYGNPSSDARYLSAASRDAGWPLPGPSSSSGGGGGSGGGGSPGQSRHSSRLSLDVFRRSSSTSAAATSDARGRSASVSSSKSAQSSQSGAASARPSAARRLSQRLHLSRAPASSDAVPPDLPEIDAAAAGEPQWEARATILARENERHRAGAPGSSAASSRPATPVRGRSVVARGGDDLEPEPGLASPPPVVSSKEIDGDIQEAIRLHEAGELAQSTALFGRLADPRGANNPLSQVLYGLALRHGWGCQPDPARAVDYLSAAASNAAAVESLALQAGLNKGGAAKGELVLAIFELANCFRNGWGVPRDAIAAKQYYETAANLGDTDAMNEVAWCYLEGFGCKKDKFASAKYYRLAEQNGNKTLGNTWIWKDKYDPANAKK